MSRTDFKVGDVVQIGNMGEKGKIIDIVKPLGTYCMYKVHTYNTGEIKTAAKHELVKGLPDEHFAELFNCFSSSEIEQVLCDFPFHDDFDQSVLNGDLQESVFCPEKNPESACVSIAEDKKPSLHIPITKKDAIPSKRFAAVPYTASEFRQMQKNKNTDSKTQSHMRLVSDFLANKNELRPIHFIPHYELNPLLQEFIMCVRQKDGSEYEPSTLRGMISSLDRNLMENNYGMSIARSKEFAQTMATLQCKGKDLKKQGKGNKRKAAHDISDDEVSLLYKAGELGNNTPSSLTNTLWFNNTLHFGIRGGAMEHRQLKWGDITLGYCNVTKCEYLEYAERQTKTRTGVNSNNCRAQNPRLYATGSDQCPVQTYKKYASQRPANFSGDEDPFYLAVVTHTKFPRDDVRWFLAQPIGLNKLKDLMKIMAKNANLPDLANGKRLTNTSVRKRLCQKLLQSNVPDTKAVLITGHKNPASLNNYRVLSNQQQKEISDILSGPNNQQSAPVNSVVEHVECHSQSVSNNQTCNSFVAHNVPSLSLFANANITGGTFHITIQSNDRN